MLILSIVLAVLIAAILVGLWAKGRYPFRDHFGPHERGMRSANPNLTNYDLAQFDPEVIDSLSAKEAQALLDDLKRDGQVLAPKDFARLRRRLREASQG